MIIIGVDFHPEFQQIAAVDTDTGEFQEKRLGHPGEAEQFYRALTGANVRVGMEGNRPLVQVAYENRPLTFSLDTGATNTDLYPPFAAAFPELIRSGTKTDSYKMEGVAGARFMEAATLESLKFSIGGFPATLKSVGVLLKPTSDASRFFAGNLGIDLLQQSHHFRAMTLTLQ